MIRIKDNIKPLVGVGLCLLLTVALTVYYALEYRYHFFWQEQNQIFLCTADYLSSYFCKPAWAAYLVGDWLTQYYYYLVAGPVILSVSILLSALSVWYALRDKRYRYVSVMAGVLVWLWLVCCSFGAYYRLSQVLCVLGGALVYIIADSIKINTRKGALPPLLVVAVPMSFWLFGYGAIVTAALSLIRSKLIYKVWSVLLLFLMPALTGGHYSLKYIDALTYPGIGRPTAAERDFEQMLGVECEYYFGNYALAALKALAVDKPNQVTAFYYYLANAKMGTLTSSLVKYPVADLGTLNTIGEATPRMVINMMNELYYELGDMMYAERASMMRNVFSPQNRNVRMIKRLAEANLVAADTLAAMKYLRILADTKTYRRWALDHTPGSMSQGVKHDIERRRTLTNRCDTMRLGDNCRVILEELLQSNPDNRMALDYLLCTGLLLKEMDTFKADYDRYCLGRDINDKLYQEALMIYLAGTGAPDEEWEKYITDRPLFKRFKQYNQRRGDPAFADTYWYYFDKR